jgi:hypothetical protein
MRKQPDHLEDYPLFYEEIGRNRQGRALAQTKKEASYERTGSLSEGQVAKLSDDLRRPIKGNPSLPPSSPQ